MINNCCIMLAFFLHHSTRAHTFPWLICGYCCLSSMKQLLLLGVISPISIPFDWGHEYCAEGFVSVFIRDIEIGFSSQCLYLVSFFRSQRECGISWLFSSASLCYFYLGVLQVSVISLGTSNPASSKLSKPPFMHHSQFMSPAVLALGHSIMAAVF